VVYSVVLRLRPFLPHFLGLDTFGTRLHGAPTGGVEMDIFRHADAGPLPLDVVIDPRPAEQRVLLDSEKPLLLPGMTKKRFERVHPKVDRKKERYKEGWGKIGRC